MGHTIHGNSSFIRRTWPGRENQMAWIQLCDLLSRGFIVTKNPNIQGGVNFPNPLDEIVCKRIVIIDDHDHVALPFLAHVSLILFLDRGQPRFSIVPDRPDEVTKNRPHESA